jgi:transcriptional regulator with XRE-family HTH domain
MPGAPGEFAAWLDATMKHRGLTQAELARAVGVADAQISRWRRGQVVPTLRYLQQIADVMGVQRVTLDRLVGYPVAQLPGDPTVADPILEAEIAEYEARFGRLLRDKVPRQMWRAYVTACEALADGLGTSLEQLRDQAEAQAHTTDGGSGYSGERNMGFRR